MPVAKGTVLKEFCPKHPDQKRIQYSDALRCPICMREGDRRRYIVRKEEIQARQRQYREEHKEELRAKSRAYYDANIESIKAKQRVWGVLRAERLRSAAIQKLGGACAVCNYKANVHGLQIDHIIPICREHGNHGEADKTWRAILRGETKNLQVLCGTCHAIKTFEENRKKVC